MESKNIALTEMYLKSVLMGGVVESMWETWIYQEPEVSKQISERVQVVKKRSETFLKIKLDTEYSFVTYRNVLSFDK
jgi:hypothetical protein